MPKSMNLLALALGLAVAGSALSALPVASKEFTYDEKVNKEMARQAEHPGLFRTAGQRPDCRCPRPSKRPIA